MANKFQSGFDQPKLVAMYLDKKMSGVEAVQTLSRLNRTMATKDKTCVIDFADAGAGRPRQRAVEGAERGDRHLGAGPSRPTCMN